VIGVAASLSLQRRNSPGQANQRLFSQTRYQHDSLPLAKPQIHAKVGTRAKVVLATTLARVHVTSSGFCALPRCWLELLWLGLMKRCASGGMSNYMQPCPDNPREIPGRNRVDTYIRQKEENKATHTYLQARINLDSTASLSA
jgi:hypothetical protein